MPGNVLLFVSLLRRSFHFSDTHVADVTCDKRAMLWGRRRSANLAETPISVPTGELSRSKERVECGAESVQDSGNVGHWRENFLDKPVTRAFETPGKDRREVTDLSEHIPK